MDGDLVGVPCLWERISLLNKRKAGWFRMIGECPDRHSLGA